MGNASSPRKWLRGEDKTGSASLHASVADRVRPTILQILPPWCPLPGTRYVILGQKSTPQPVQTFVGIASAKGEPFPEGGREREEAVGHVGGLKGRLRLAGSRGKADNLTARELATEESRAKLELTFVGDTSPSNRDLLLSAPSSPSSPS